MRPRKSTAVSGLGKELAATRRALVKGQILFAQELGVQQSSLAGWESGARPIPVSTLLQIAKIAPEEERAFWLDHAGALTTEPASQHDRKPKPRSLFVEVPLVVGLAGAGPGRQSDSEEVEGMLSLPRDMIPNPSETKCIRISGESMLPTISPAALAAVDGSQRRVEKLLGKIVAAYHETEGLVVKRMVNVEGRNRLASDNPGYTPLDLDAGWQVVGKVVWWVQMA